MVALNPSFQPAQVSELGANIAAWINHASARLADSLHVATDDDDGPQGFAEAIRLNYTAKAGRYEVVAACVVRKTRTSDDWRLRSRWWVASSPQNASIVFDLLEEPKDKGSDQRPPRTMVAEITIPVDSSIVIVLELGSKGKGTAVLEDAYLSVKRVA